MASVLILRAVRLCLGLPMALAPFLAGAAEPAHKDASSSPVEQRIEAARKRLQTAPKSWQSYYDLAAALCRKARDRADVAVYDQAQAALDRCFELSPDNFEARKLQATVWLGKHQFAEALKLATELNNKTHDDLGAWSLLVDANAALGNYAEAERDAQWILDLRPGSSLGFEKAAGLRVLFGDPAGAIEFFNEAERRISQNDADQHAWLLTQSAREELALGKTDEAGKLLAEALKWFPDSQLALEVMAHLRIAEGKYSDAAALFDKRYRATPNAANLYDWAAALEASGQTQQAAAAFAKFETIARAEVSKPYNSNLELIYFYVDRKAAPAEALALAERETAMRQDCATLEAYAWALYRTRRYVEAAAQMNRALAVGVRDPVYFCHAAQIAAKTNDATSEKRFRKELAALPTSSSCPLNQPVESAREVQR